jgi:hypothetical protein
VQLDAVGTQRLAPMASRDIASSFTSFFVHNLHCDGYVNSTDRHAMKWRINLCRSCKAAIEDSLRQLNPSPISVVTSLTDRRVSVVHPGGLSSAEILELVRRLGFLVAEDLPLPSRWPV